MAVKLKTVINAMDLAAEVLAAAAGVIEGAKQLGVDVDAVGGAVKGAADGAANGVRTVVDGVGTGLGVAADGVGAAVGALGGAVKAFQDSREAAEARKKISAARQSIFESASTVIPLHKYVCQQKRLPMPRLTALICLAATLSQRIKRAITIRTTVTIWEFMWDQASICRMESCPHPHVWATRMSMPITSIIKT